MFAGCKIPYPKREFIADETDENKNGSKQALQQQQQQQAIPPTVPAHAHQTPMDQTLAKKARPAQMQSMDQSNNVQSSSIGNPMGIVKVSKLLNVKMVKKKFSLNRKI